MWVSTVVELDLGGHAVLFGEITNDCLVRIHARCLYGDALGCENCSCGSRLRDSMDCIQAARAGVLIYLEHDDCDEAGSTGVERMLDSEIYERLARFLSDELSLNSVKLLTDRAADATALCAAGLTAIQVPIRRRVRAGRIRGLPTKLRTWLRVGSSNPRCDGVARDTAPPM